MTPERGEFAREVAGVLCAWWEAETGSRPETPCEACIQLAAAIMPLLERREREAEARALRDAADEWAETHWYDVAAMQLRNSFVSSLRGRADSIAPEVTE